MISTYSELKTAIYKWLIKDSNDPFYDSSTLDNIIYLAEAEMNRRMRVRQMRVTDTVAITASNNASDLPDDFIEAYSVYLNSPIQEVQSASAGVFSRNNLYLNSGSPTYYYITEGQFIWGPIPDSDYSAEVEYYKKIPGLSGTQTTNDIIRDFPDIYLFTCLKHAYIAGQDVEREGVYEQRIAVLLAEANSKDRKAAISKGSRGVARPII